MPTPPTIISYSRNGETGTLIVDNVPVGVNVHAYGITYTDPSPKVIYLGQATSNGGQTSIDLDLSEASWKFFALTIPAPCVVFAVSEEGGNYSPPSNSALPSFSLSLPEEISIELVEKEGETAKLHVNGISELGGAAYLFWTALDTFQIQMANADEEGDIVISGLAPHIDYIGVLFYFTNELSVGGVTTILIPGDKTYYQITRRSNIMRVETE